MVAIWLRNTMLNQALLVLTLAGILTVPWIAWFTLPQQTVEAVPRDLIDGAPMLILPAIPIKCLISFIAGRQLERFHFKPQERQAHIDEMLGHGGVLRLIVVPLMIAVGLLADSIYRTLPHFADHGVG